MLGELRETFPPCIMLNGRLERPAGLWILQKLSGLKCQREDEEGGEELKKNISRIASSNADELSQQMLTSRERKKSKREKGCTQSGSIVAGMVACNNCIVSF